MQNRYTGDVGDLGKYGLLRYLSGHTAEDEGVRLDVAIIWYFHHDEIHVGNRQRINGDGGHTSYLRRTATDDKVEYRNCDVELWEMLRDLVYRNARCVHCAEQSGLLPEETQFYGAPLVYLPGSPLPLRQQMRTHWWGRALRATRDSEIVCCDPDNGIGANNLIHDVSRGTKYTYYSDLADLWNRGQSLVVYHHLGRTDNDQQAQEKAQELSENLEGNPEVVPLIFNRGTPRVFLVSIRPEHADPIRERIDRFLDGPWAAHFRRAGQEGQRPRPAPRQPRAGAGLWLREGD